MSAYRITEKSKKLCRLIDELAACKEALTDQVVRCRSNRLDQIETSAKKISQIGAAMQDQVQAMRRTPPKSNGLMNVNQLIAYLHLHFTESEREHFMLYIRDDGVDVPVEKIEIKDGVRLRLSGNKY